MINKPTNTESTFASNKQVDEIAGVSNIRRDTDNVQDIRISLYDVDYAILYHLENTIKPTITEGNDIVTVPFIFASAEKWASIKKYGFIRDNQGKILTPMISIRRAGITPREDLKRMNVSEASENRIILEKKYSAQNRYDAFSLTRNKQPNKEFYALSIPKFVELQYELIIWTNYTFQMNEIIEQLLWFDGKAFGDTYKFITHVESPTPDQTNTIGEDRLVKTTISLRTKAYILNPTGPNAPAMNKLVSVNKIITMAETDTTAEQYALDNRSNPPGYEQDLFNL